jgi:ATP-dependent DNA helicase
MNRLILTGTPLQNNLVELWSLLNFLLPEIFDDLGIFESWFNIKKLQYKNGTEKLLKQEEEKQVLMMLRTILKPFMLRREKSDVCFDIPPKKEIIIYAPLTELQHDLYKAVLNYNIEVLNKIKESEIIISAEDGKRPKRQCVLKNSIHTSVRSSSRNKKSLSSNTSLQETNIDKIKNIIDWNIMKPRDQKKLLMWKEYINVTEHNKDFLINIQISNKGKHHCANMHLYIYSFYSIFYIISVI